MRPGMQQQRHHKSSRREVELPLPLIKGGATKPLALPPIPAPSAAAPATGDSGQPQSQPLAPREAVRGEDGALVPAVSVAPQPPQQPEGSPSNERDRAGRALTARKPALGAHHTSTGRLTGRLRTLEVTRTAAAGPVSQFPVHGGATVARTAVGQAARPPLAIELEGFVKREMNLLKRQMPSVDALATAPVAKEAFGCFIGHFPEYAPALELIKRLYDDCVSAAQALRQQKHVLETENIGFRDYHRTVLEKEQAEAKQAATDAHATIDQLQALVDRQATRQKELELELHRMTNTLTDRNKQLDECESRAMLFEKAVIELTDKGVGIQQRLTAVRRDNERLHHTITMLEQQVREAEAAAIDNGMAMSFGRSQRSVNRGGTIATSMGNVPAMRNVIREAVVTTSGKAGSNVAGSGGDGPTASTVKFEEDFDDALADIDMPLPGEDTREAVMELEARLKRVTRQNFLLQSERQALLQRVESLQANLEREKNEMTPRPPWPSAQEVLQGFQVNPLATSEETLGDLIQHFKDELADDRRDAEKQALSNTVRDWLGQEDLCEGDLVGKHRYFVCRGTGGHVPVYLRARGVVRNRKLRKGDCEKLLAKFWADRRISLRIETNLNATPVQDYFHEWLTNVTGNGKAAVELAYNMLAVCEQYQHDPDCAMFLRILRGELCEHAMFEQHDLLANLEEVFRANDPKKKNFLSRFTINRILNKFFPTKSRQEMLRLRFALMLSSKGQTMVDYDTLFSEDEDGNQSRFVETIRRQHVEEATVFTVEVEEAIREAIREDGKLDLNNARMALKHLDPAMPNSRIEDVVAFGCGMTLSEMEQHGQFFAVDAEPFLARLRRGVLLHRYSRRPPADGEEDEGSASETEDGEEEDVDRQRALEEDAEPAEIVIPEGRMRKSQLFSEATRMEASMVGGPPKAVPAGSPVQPSSASLQPTGSLADLSGSASSVASGGKFSAAAKQNDFSFLNAFRRRGQTADGADASSAPPEGTAAKGPDAPRSSAAQRRRSSSLAVAMSSGAGEPISASAAFAAVKGELDATRPKPKDSSFGDPSWS